MDSFLALFFAFFASWGCVLRPIIRVGPLSALPRTIGGRFWAGENGFLFSVDGVLSSRDGVFLSQDEVFCSRDGPLPSAEGLFLSSDDPLPSPDHPFLSPEDPLPSPDGPRGWGLPGLAVF